MTTPITLRIQQKGYIRPQGYQAVQWAVTVPISVPPGSPPIATDPLSLATLFVVRNVGGFETFERVATPLDLNTLAPQSLVCFDIRGAGGDVALASVLPGDKLGVLNPPSTWIVDEPPYTDAEYTIGSRGIRAQGGNASVGPSGLTIPSYNFRPEDIGRWVYLSGFLPSGGSNGWAQILSYLGNVAQVDRVFTINETGGSWAFYFLQTDPSAVPSGSEPQYLPTAASGLTWKLMRGPSTIVATGDGGVSYRQPQPNPLSLASRFTYILPTAQALDDLFLVTRQQVDALQRALTLGQIQFLNTITHTIGP